MVIDGYAPTGRMSLRSRCIPAPDVVLWSNLPGGNFDVASPQNGRQQSGEA